MSRNVDPDRRRFFGAAGQSIHGAHGARLGHAFERVR